MWGKTYHHKGSEPCEDNRIRQGSGGGGVKRGTWGQYPVVQSIAIATRSHPDLSDHATMRTVEGMDRAVLTVSWYPLTARPTAAPPVIKIRVRAREKRPRAADPTREAACRMARVSPPRWCRPPTTTPAACLDMVAQSSPPAEGIAEAWKPEVETPRQSWWGADRWVAMSRHLPTRNDPMQPAMKNPTPLFAPLLR